MKLDGLPVEGFDGDDSEWVSSAETAPGVELGMDTLGCPLIRVNGQYMPLCPFLVPCWARRGWLTQCCPMDTYDTDSAGDLRAVCSCGDDCDCMCAGCICENWGADS